jgi:hypothetical protein
MNFRVCLHVIHSPTINHIQFGEMITKRFICSSHYFSTLFKNPHLKCNYVMNYDLRDTTRLMD